MPNARCTADARREQLLDVTKAIVAQRGFHAVSIEAVAREAGITRPIVYGHFRDLPGLLEALVEREGARALAQLATVLPTDLGRATRARRCSPALRGYLEAVRADPETWRLVLMPPEGAPPLLHERIAARPRRGRRAARPGGRPRARARPRVARPGADRAHAVGDLRRGRAAAADRPGAATRSSGS